jgi:hypothetical protein
MHERRVLRVLLVEPDSTFIRSPTCDLQGIHLDRIKSSQWPAYYSPEKNRHHDLILLSVSLPEPEARDVADFFQRSTVPCKVATCNPEPEPSAKWLKENIALWDS